MIASKAALLICHRFVKKQRKLNETPRILLRLDRRKLPILTALRIEIEQGSCSNLAEAENSLRKKGYFEPPPRPWRLDMNDKGMGRVDFVVLDRFGDVVVENLQRSTAELIISAVNQYAG